MQCVDCVKDGARTIRRGRTVFGGEVAPGTPVVTYTIVGLCAAVFLLQLVRPEVTAEFIFAPVLAWREPWRALTAAFLHSTSMLLHIVMNMLFLVQIGPYLESMLGRARFAALYLLSAIGGSAMVLLLARAPTGVLTSQADLVPFESWITGVVGASGAVFGLFAALVVVNRRLGRSSTGLYAVLAINAVFGFIYPNISWQAHLGGLITGAAIAAILAALGRRRELVRYQWPALAGVLVLIVGLAVAKLLTVPEFYR